MSENILFICAHSDDHIIGAGGTIARYIEEGKKVNDIADFFGVHRCSVSDWISSYRKYGKEKIANNQRESLEETVAAFTGFIAGRTFNYQLS